jgi:glycerol uptake facilitator-like aquaporin
MLRKVTAEFLGTGLLVSTVVGSGTMAQNLTHDVGIQLLINTVATVLVLGLLIELFAPISGSHFNPVVTVIFALRREIAPVTALGYIAAQFLGGLFGAILANLMFQKPAIFLSQHVRTGTHLYIGEVVATAGLVWVIFQAIAIGKSNIIPILVPAWIGAAYFFTSSTSFANPAVTFARGFSNTFSGIAFSSVPGFVVAQIIGGIIGFGFVAFFSAEKNGSK